ncbi:hypothetical protein LPJ53_005372 [Coemansia erecta]|uniref:ER membrane protein complex subunit 10 n=1 Tax=Coemansia erecta TaxID=147472 RepID=A0A9W7XSL2_9FUNG|nr:hypothetical protein LPJ53_005372 [Coemansia erecta]
MRLLNPSALLPLLVLGALAGVCAEPLVPDTLSVYDNLNSDQFTQRGELVLSDPAEYSPVGLQNPPVIKYSTVANWTTDNSMYAVLLQSHKTDAQLVLTVPRCRLNGDQAIKERFVVHAAADGGLLHVDYTAGKAANCKDAHAVPETPKFTTDVVVKRRVQGPTPELAQAPSIDLTTGKEKTPEPQKSFLVKYWYYIVPVMLLLLLGGGEEPQQEGNARR